MNASVRKSIHTGIARAALLTLLPSAMPLVAASAEQPVYASDHADEYSPLITKVRRATAQFRYIGNLPSDWVQATPCVSGPDSGAMGVHFVSPARLNDGKLVADEPEALIYEPTGPNSWRLVGVEYIVLESDWLKDKPKDATVPDVDGILTNYIPAPNRFGLPAFYELHVWAWQDNPKGSFADWNSRVSCEKTVPKSLW